MNRVFLTNTRVTRIPEIMKNDEGVIYSHLTLAAQKEWQKEGEERAADFITATIFGKSAEAFAKYVTPKVPVNIEGHLQSGSYMKNEETIYTLKLIIDKWEFAIGSKKEDPNKEEESDEGNI